jgi:hypothetical protein
MLRLLVFVSLLLLASWSPVVAQTECAPCDVSTSECETEPYEGTLLHLHRCDGLVECFKFYRRACGQAQWTLIYEGDDNTFCDPEYTLGACVQYKGERWLGIDGGACTEGMQCDEESLCPGGC